MTTESTEPGTPPTAEHPPVRLPREQREALAALVAPYLRAWNDTVGAEDPTFPDEGVMLLADPSALVDAMHAAGVLVFDDTTDRRQLRAAWAAMSAALIHLSKDQPLTAEVLAAVPASHRFYLMGHEAAHKQLAKAWGRMIGSREALAALLRRGRPATRAELGEVLVMLGGDNRFATPLVDDDADPGDRTYVAAVEAAAELGRLVRRGVLAEDNPAVVAAVVVADSLTRIRAGEPEPTRTDQEDAARLLAAAPRPDAVHASVDGKTLARQVDYRAIEMLPALGPLGPGEAAAAAPLDWRHLPRALQPLVPADARAYALPWPAGTRALYDPAAGVTVREVPSADPLGDVEVMSRTLFVPFGEGDDADLFPVGTVRRVDLAGLTPKDRWWLCRYCGLGATGSASYAAEQAECLGHEAICSDQDRVRVSVPAGTDRHA